jgi:hypothetical protein
MATVNTGLLRTTGAHRRHGPGLLRLLPMLCVVTVLSACCRFPVVDPVVTPGPAITVTGRVEAVENNRDHPDGICQIREEYYVLTTATERYVLMGARDPIYAEDVNHADELLRVRSMVGLTVTVKGQLMSVWMPDPGIECRWLRPETITK